MIFTKNLTFYILLTSGIIFIIVGIASVIYNNIPIKVTLNDKVKPGVMDILTHNMNIGNTANVTAKGSALSITIKDPNRHIIRNENNVSSFNYDFTAKMEGQYKIEVKNIGDSELNISGDTFTKGSTIALSGQIMLIITGIIVTGLGLRLRIT